MLSVHLCPIWPYDFSWSCPFNKAYLFCRIETWISSQSTHTKFSFVAIGSELGSISKDIYIMNLIYIYIRYIDTIAIQVIWSMCCTSWHPWPMAILYMGGWGETNWWSSPLKTWAQCGHTTCAWLRWANNVGEITEYVWSEFLGTC